jgi:hypothetical protein
MVLAVLARSCGREEERLQACFSIAAYNAGDTDPTESHTGLNRPGWTSATPHTANAATMWGQCHTLGSQCCHPVGPIPPLRQPTLPLCGPNATPWAANAAALWTNATASSPTRNQPEPNREHTHGPTEPGRGRLWLTDTQDPGVTPPTQGTQRTTIARLQGLHRWPGVSIWLPQ